MTTPHAHERFWTVLGANLTLLLFELLVASNAQAGVCSATAFSCPPTGTCVITGTWDVGSDCMLDFGTIPIEVRGTLQAETVGGSFAVAAPSVRLNAGKLKSLGDASTSGGDIRVITGGAFVMEGSGPRIDTSGIGGGGDIEVLAQSATINTGLIVAEGGTGADCGDGGDVRLEVAQGLTIASVVRNNTAGSDCSGGSIALTGSFVTITGEINARGGAGAQGDAISITATNGNVDMSSTAFLRADGTGQSDGVGSDGGQIAIAAPLGSVTVAGPVTATGNAPDGVAGSLVVSSGGAVHVTGAVNVSGAGTGAGGSVIVSATGAVSIDAEIRAIGGSTYPGGQGGTVQVRSQGSVAVASSILASAASAGTVVVSGNPLTLSGSITARGVRGNGGRVEIGGCSVQWTGIVDTGASQGGAAGGIAFHGASLAIGATGKALAVPCAGANCTTIEVRTGGLSITDPTNVTPSPIISFDDSLPAC